MADGSGAIDPPLVPLISPSPSPSIIYPDETKGLILALCSGLFAGTAYTIVRKMN